MDLVVLVGAFFLLLFLGIPIAFALCLSALAYLVLYSQVPLIIIAQQMLKGVDSFTLMAIPFFVIAGCLMQNGGISRRIVDFAKKLVGWLPGGMAVVDIVASMIFAAMTGAGAATTAAVGGIMIPSMEEEGYDPGFASAIQAMGGIFGPIIPPSILMVLYAVASGESVGDMLMAGLLPGLLLGLVLIVVVVLLCVKKGYTGKSRFNAGEALRSFGRAFFALLAPLIILGGIYGGIFTPTEAAAVSVVYGLIVGLFIYREVKIKDLYDLLVDSGKTTGGIMLIIGAAALFSYICTVYGISKAAQTLLLTVAGNKYVFLIIVNVIFLIAGCFVDANSAMYIFIPIMYPVAQQLGIDLVHFGVIATVNLAIGQVTPPVGVNLFVAIGVSDKLQNIKDKTRVTIETMSKAVWPMIIACIVALLLVTYIPFFSTVFLKGA